MVTVTIGVCLHSYANHKWVKMSFRKLTKCHLDHPSYFAKTFQQMTWERMKAWYTAIIGCSWMCIHRLPITWRTLCACVLLAILIASPGDPDLVPIARMPVTSFWPPPEYRTIYRAACVLTKSCIAFDSSSNMAKSMQIYPYVFGCVYNPVFRPHCLHAISYHNWFGSVMVPAKLPGIVSVPNQFWQVMACR